MTDETNDGAQVAEAVTELEAPDAETQLAEAQAKAAEYLDGWQRAQADFANFKKRMERERADTWASASDAVIQKFVGVLDDFERALKDRPPPPAEAAKWADGVELIYRKLQAILEVNGVTRMEAEGQSFDPRLHEALTHEESETHADGQIIEVVQAGYVRGDRVIRPAMVRVAKKQEN